MKISTGMGLRRSPFEVELDALHVDSPESDAARLALLSRRASVRGSILALGDGDDDEGADGDGDGSSQTTSTIPLTDSDMSDSELSDLEPEPEQPAVELHHEARHARGVGAAVDACAEAAVLAPPAIVVDGLCACAEAADGVEVAVDAYGLRH